MVLCHTNSWNKGANPYTECKRQVFNTKETPSNIRSFLCSDNGHDETFEDCMDSAILTHEVMKRLFNERLQCIKNAVSSLGWLVMTGVKITETNEKRKRY